MATWSERTWKSVGESAALAAAIFAPQPYGTIALIAGSLIGLIWPDKSTRELPESPSYGWDFGENPSAGKSPPMPILYGKTRIKPIVKNRFIVQEGNKEFLYALYGFTGHQIDENTSFEGNACPEWGDVSYALGDYVRYKGHFYRAKRHIARGLPAPLPIGVGKTDFNWTALGDKLSTGDTAKITDIVINGNPLKNYQEVTAQTRPGLADQLSIADFYATFSNQAQNTLLTDEWQIVAVETAPVDDVQLDFLFPNGLYVIDGYDVARDYLRLEVEYRTALGDGWSDWNTIKRVANAEGGFDYVGDNAGPYYEKWGEFNAREINPFTRSIRISGAISHSGLDRTYYSSGTYEIRVRHILRALAVTPTCRLVNVAGITETYYTYPSEALLGIKALATANLQGKIETTAVVERSQVYVHNGSAWVLKAANNHAWAVYDLLANGHADHPMLDSTVDNADGSHYGCAIAGDKIDYDSFNTWATNIMALGFQCNIVFDTFMNPWDAIMRLQEEGRGIVRVIGNKITAIALKQETPTQLFTQGNIIQGSFKQRWLNKEKRPNNIEVTYWDKTRNYERTTLAVRSASWDSNTDPDRTQAIYLYGCTDMDQALKTARFRLRYNELYDQLVTFDTSVDALEAQIGDVIKVQSDIAQWGTGGRIETVYDETFETWLQIDKEITMTHGDTYEIEIRHTNDTLEKKTIYDQAYWIKNGDFATNLLYWTELYDATFIRHLTKHHGGPCLKVLTAGGNGQLDGARNDSFRPTHGKTYTVSAWVRSEWNGTVKMTLSKAGTGIDRVTFPYDDWFLLSVTFTANCNVAEYLRVDIQENADYPAVYGYYIGAVMIVEGTSVGNPASTDSVTEPVTTDTIRTSAAWGFGYPMPVQYDIYTITDEDLLYKLFRIIDITRSGDLNRSIVAMEYSDELFTEALVIPDITIEDKEEFASILHLLAKEVPSERDPLLSAIRLSWAITAGGRGGQWEVWVRDVTAKDVGHTGDWDNAPTYDTGDKVIHNGRLYVSTVDSNQNNEPFS